MKPGIKLSTIQTLLLQAAGIGAMIGIYFALSAKVDIKEPFVVGVYLASCAATIWALRKWIASNTDERGKIVRRKK